MTAAPRGRPAACGSVGALRAEIPRRMRHLGRSRVAESNAGTDRDVRATESGIPVERVYDEASVADLDLAERLG